MEINQISITKLILVLKSMFVQLTYQLIYKKHELIYFIRGLQQQQRFELQIGWMAIDSHLKTVGWQLLLEDACKVRGVHRRGPVLSGKIGKEERCQLVAADGFLIQELHHLGCQGSIYFGFGQRLPLCASFDFLRDVTAMWDKVMLDVKTYAS